MKEKILSMGVDIEENEPEVCENCAKEFYGLGVIFSIEVTNEKGKTRSFNVFTHTGCASRYERKRVLANG